MNGSCVYSRASWHQVVKQLRKTGTKSSQLASQLSTFCIWPMAWVFKRNGNIKEGVKNLFTEPLHKGGYPRFVELILVPVQVREAPRPMLSLRREINFMLRTHIFWVNYLQTLGLRINPKLDPNLIGSRRATRLFVLHICQAAPKTIYLKSYFLEGDFPRKWLHLHVNQESTQ